MTQFIQILEKQESPKKKYYYLTKDNMPTFPLKKWYKEGPKHIAV